MIINKISKDITFKKKIYLIFINISIFLFLANIWSIKYVVVSTNDFLGLTSHLDPSYWIGLAIVTILSIKIYIDTTIKNRYIFIFLLLSLGIFLFGLGILAEQHARVAVAYYPAGEVDTLLANGHIDLISEYPVIAYRSWPSLHFISASIMYLCNAKNGELINYMPFHWIFCIILLTFALGIRLKFSSNNSFLLSYLFLSSFILVQYYYSPQALAFILYVIIFLIIISSDNRISSILILIISFSSLVVMHGITSIASFLGILMVSTYNIHNEKNDKYLRQIFLFLSIICFWYIFLSPLILNIGVDLFMQQLLNMDFLAFTGSAKYNTQIFTLSRYITKYFSLAYTFIYSICLLGAFFIYRKGKIEIENRMRLEKCFIWLLGIFLIALVKYGHEADERTYMLGLIPIICILIISFSNKKVFPTLMILFIVLHIPAHYGGESCMQTLDEELNGSNFFAKNIIPAEIYFYNFAPYVWYYNNSLVNIPFTSLEYSNIGINIFNKVRYIIDSTRYRNNQIYINNRDPIKDWIQLEGIEKTNLLYSNGGFRILENFCYNHNISP